ncbi:MAG: aminopeptidase [Caldilineaceae bacterium]
MANRSGWCAGGCAHAGLGGHVLPDLAPAAAEAALWELILQTCRRPEDLVAARAGPRRRLTVAAALMAQQVRALRFRTAHLPTACPPPISPHGLTAQPNWVAAPSAAGRRVRFPANMPTEEVFTTPHAAHPRLCAHLQTPLPL